MVDEDTVRSEARDIASDARSTQDLSDAETACLRDMLNSDEAFALLVTAQQNAVLVDADTHDIDEDTEHLATVAAGRAGNAIDCIVEDRIEQTREIVALADDMHERFGWTTAWKLHAGGYETVDAIREADQDEIVEQTGMSPQLVASVTAHHGGQEGES